VNPFVELWRAPVATLTAAAYAVVLLAMLITTWYAAGRNALYLYAHWQKGWLALPPLGYTFRVVGMLLVAAVDLLLLGGIIYLVT